MPEINGQQTVGMLIAKHLGMWPRFITYLSDNIDQLDVSDPLDTYTENSTYFALRQFEGSPIVRFAHQKPPKRVAMQHLAHVCGFANRSASHLCVHPVYGPWIGLRGVIIFEEASSLPQIEKTNPCDMLCVNRCGTAFSAEMALMSNPTHASLRKGWKNWLRIRDLCSVGKVYRYTQPQLEYHYTTDKDILRQEVVHYKNQMA